MTAESIKKSIEILGKLVTKTPLNEKLLSKPPFRYLHDLISEIIRKSGICKDLYTAHEQNSENVKDKVNRFPFV
jgi:TRAF3-interacting protein 1